MSPMSRGHVVADADPAALGPVHAVDAAVVLLVEPVGVAAGAAGRSAGRGRTPARDRARTSAAQPGVERCPVAAAVGALEHAAAPTGRGRGASASRGSTMTECSIEPSGVFSSGHSHHVSHIGWSFQPCDRLPRVAAVVAAEQALGRAARVPDAGLVGVARRQPEHRVAGCAASAVAGRERRRAASPRVHVRPRSSERNTVGPRWPVRGREQQRAAVARVEHHVLRDVAEEHRPVAVHDRRSTSAVEIHAPLRVPTSKLGVSVIALPPRVVRSLRLELRLSGPRILIAQPCSSLPRHVERPPCRAATVGP